MIQIISLRPVAPGKLVRILLLATLALQLSFANAEELSLAISDEVEVLVDRYPAKGDYLILWLAPEYGFRQAHRSMAQRLSRQGIEVWQIDIAESLFMPRGTASLKQLDGRYTADLIEHAHHASAKRIVLAGDSYAAISALRGARQWQDRQSAQAVLLGAVLFTPYSYAYIPALGQEPEYLPVIESTNIPLLIYQAKKSATFNRFNELLEKLRGNESPIYTRLVPDVMSLFYQEPPTSSMQKNAQTVSTGLKPMLALLARHEVPARPIPLKRQAIARSGIDIYLKTFAGKAQPAPISLIDIDGNAMVKNDFGGNVTLVNFWASWCPPCVEEIPSLNRLQRKMAGRPFELISINYAEDKATVAEFLQRVRVEFPVLLDSTGDYARQWKVISYPSTFVIDASGQIRYGVNAAIEWDSPEVIQKLESLMK